MSLPLRDFRLGITEGIHAALEAESIAFDRPMEAVAREILQQWAARKHRAYTVYARRVIANGNQAELPGLELEGAGTNRKTRK
jgi:hypothetical protein